MEIQLPLHVAQALGVNERHEKDLIIQSVQLLDREIGPLLSESAKTQFSGLLGTPIPQSLVEVTVCPAEIPEWRYRTIEFNGSTCARVVEIPSARTPGSLPPTDAEVLLVQAWLTTDKLTNAEHLLRNNVVVFEWLPGVPEAAKAVTRAISGVSAISGPATTTRSWSNAGLVALNANSRLLDHKDGEFLRRLFVESATETAPRWRFLSLYRILEHGYLENVFNELSHRFFTEPNDALEAATNSLKSELSQFIKLADKHGLKTYFEEISRINDSLVASGNQFAILVEREAKKKGSFPESYKRGVAVCYQIRCSIVHAGTHSVVFDKSPGAEAALTAQLTEIEKAAAKFLGIQTA